MLLSKVIEQFLLWSRYGRRNPVSKQTFETSKCIFKILLERWGDIKIKNITLNEVMMLKQYYYDRKCSDGYIYRILCGIKTLLKYCEEELQLEVLDRKKIKLPKREDPDPEYLTDEEVGIVFSKIDLSTICGLRLAALFALQIETGLRISEALSIDIEDVHFKDSCISIKGKGGKKRVVFFKELATHYLTTYIHARTDRNSALFVNHEHNDSRWDDRCARKHYDNLRAKSGITKLKSHICRRTFGTNLLKNGADILSIQHLLGHSTLKYTQRYLGVDWEFIKSVHNQRLNYNVDLTSDYKKDTLPKREIEILIK